MRKKRENAVSESEPSVDLKSLIHQHSLFFDKLVDLIPAKFYLPIDDEGKKWFPGLSKPEKDLLKKESRKNIKKSRRERLDPDSSSRTTLDLLKQKLEKQKAESEKDNDKDVETSHRMSGLEDDDRPVTYEELRQRLYQRIEQLRAGRNNSGTEKEKKKNDKKAKNQPKKRKREPESGEKKPTATSKTAENVEKDATEAAKELKFNQVKMGSKDEQGKKKKRKISKLKELEKAKELEEAKKDPEKAEKHSWKSAESRASGIKVHDDAKLLKRSLKKDKKRHQKSVGKWKERVETQQKMKAERQQTRSKHIADRIQDKKNRRIAKREKKLLRPGFEGRKEGYINENSS